ncbi:patatin-like phospholipase family protein, partial [Mycobacterium sp.]|uniref:patatin-like phospholipase family protein n=1 Tax=Mycobacterium sp. TaxID=1785 RepID=UPI002D2DE56A
MAEPVMSELTSSTAKTRVLRLALAMRGGVSLAVWIGGAVAELDLFRRACSCPNTSATELTLADGENQRHHERAIIYRQLLALTKYHSVEIDILAGASAGGLNAVLYGLAQTAGTVMDDTVRRTWVECGAIWDLLQKPGFSRVTSILQGDGRFFTVVRTALGKIANPDSAEGKWKPLVNPDARTDRVAVELAATLLDDIHNPHRDNRARFSFVKNPGDLASNYTTIPGGHDTRQSAGIALDRMALAARSTSSFPGAFEPADIYSTAEDTPGTGLDVDMARAFLYARSNAKSDKPFNVIDGGVFDNIPIDRAIRCIQRAPASMPSKRWLIYLDPEPPTPSEPTKSSKNASSALGLVPVIRGSMALKQRTESAADELGPLRENNDQVLQIRARQEALAAALADTKGEDLTIEDLITKEAYLKCRIALDAERIAILLTDPWSELCRPPRPAVDYAALNSSQALEIKDWLRHIYFRAQNSWDFSTDIFAMLGWVRTLIAWVHALEDVLEGLANDSPQRPSGQSYLAEMLESWKHRLYRCLIVLIEAKQQAVDSILAQPLADNPVANHTYSEATLGDCLCDSYDHQRRLKISSQLIWFLWYDDPDDAGFYNWLGNVDALGDDIDGQPLGEFMRWTLDGIKVSIAKYSRCVVDNLPDIHKAWLQNWENSVFRRFYDQPLSAFPIENLAKLFVVTGGPAAVPIITFDQINSDERPAIA